MAPKAKVMLFMIKKSIRESSEHTVHITFNTVDFPTTFCRNLSIDVTVGTMDSSEVFDCVTVGLGHSTDVCDCV